MQLHRAIADGANCFGVHQWTFIDNWSWINAFKRRYGFWRLDLELQIQSPEAVAPFEGIDPRPVVDKRPLVHAKAVRAVGYRPMQLHQMLLHQQSEGEPGADGVIDDTFRIQLMEEHLVQLHRAIADGANCFGVHQWLSPGAAAPDAPPSAGCGKYRLSPRPPRARPLIVDPSRCRFPRDTT